MRDKQLLAAFLLGVSLCFIPVLGYGEVEHWAYEAKASYMKVFLLEARVDYVMANPNTFLKVVFLYDPSGSFRRDAKLPWRVNTKRKVCVMVRDIRGVFSHKSGTVLLEEFKKQLEVAYSCIDSVATNMHTDIVAIFDSKEEIPLGYFYQGEYYLWEK
jgi:hypothetical protein